MGFPRILSKTNKIYTKLGEFCLSADGQTFLIVCHTCQEELTQDHFWKHIQDEHNFPHGSKQDHNEATTTLMPLPLPLYRKMEAEQRIVAHHDDTSQEEQKPKDYTEMRAIALNASGVDIKMEPHSLPPPAAQVEVTATQTLYQMPQVPPVNAYAAIVHAPTLPAISMTVGQPQSVNAMLTQVMPKEEHSTTASASSAVSSEDGERWYVCDFETCGLKFKYQSRLELHRSVHSKERRFACDLCGASFKQSCNLSTHRKKKHFLKGSKGLVQQHY